MQQVQTTLSNSTDMLAESDSLIVKLLPLTAAQICGECEKHHACFNCEECGQQLCPKCDKKLHNKGKRAAHIREVINKNNGNSHFTSSDEKTDKTSSVRSSLEQLSLTSKKVAVFPDNKDSIKTGSKQRSNMVSEEVSQTKNNILEKLNESPIADNTEKFDKFEKLHQSLNITTNENQSFALSFNNESHFINQSFTEDFAREIPIDDYQGFKNIDLLNSLELSKCIQMILRNYAEQGDVIIKKEIFEQNLLRNYKNIDLSAVLKEAEDKKIIQIISRKFGDSKPRFYVSLLLDNLSIQSLFWTIKSLINDQLTPNEKMLLSRIKEAFAIKLNPVIWQGVWKYLQKKANENQNLIIIPNLASLKIVETFNQQGNLLKIITMKDVSPLLIDQESLTLKDQQIWDEFLKFLESFFEEKTTNNFTKKAEKAKWSSSVETFLSKNKTKPLIIPPKSSSKAIPGGKYGCAQLIKCCGPENLAKLSLGKLSVLAQEAINRKLLDHYKTLLIKSNRFVLGVKLSESPIENLKPEEKNPEIKHKIQRIKQIIIDLLREYPNGISLAKLPAEIKKKVNFYYDLHEIGFNKLKDFFIELPNVEIIEMKGSKLSIAKLKKSDFFNFEQRNILDPEHLMQGFNEIIRKTIDCHPQGISGSELIASIRKIYGNDYHFHHILSNDKTFLTHLMNNFSEMIDIAFSNKDMLIVPHKNTMNIIPKNLANTNFSNFQNETLKSDFNADSTFNSANKSHNFFNSMNSNNNNTSLFNTNVSSINQTTTPFMSNNNEENNTSYDEIVKALQKTSMGQSHVSYSYFGNRNSISNPISEKKKGWNKNFEPQSINQDPDLLYYLSNIHKARENNTNITNGNVNRFKTH